jgi:hypothetical protein
MAESGGALPDPLALWKQLTDTQEQAWSKALQEMMATDAFAAAMGRSLENLTNVQGTVTRALDQYYRNLNLPSRTDVTRLATEVAELRAAVLRLGDRIDELGERWEAQNRAPVRSAAERPAPARSTARKQAARRAAAETGGDDAPTDQAEPAKKPVRAGKPAARSTGRVTPK